MKTLRHVYKYESTALIAAKAEYARLKRGVATFSINLAHGKPELFPEMPCQVLGFKSDIDSTKWIISQVTHTINSNGLTTQLNLELNNS